MERRDANRAIVGRQLSCVAAAPDLDGLYVRGLSRGGNISRNCNGKRKRRLSKPRNCVQAAVTLLTAFQNRKGMMVGLAFRLRHVPSAEIPTGPVTFEVAGQDLNAGPVILSRGLRLCCVSTSRAPIPLFYGSHECSAVFFDRSRVMAAC